jgi:isopenicillin N synthase-like dioxygenase
LPAFSAAWLDYYRAMEILGARIMSLLAAALALDDDFFVPLHSHHISALRGINYPSMGIGSAAGRSRAGAHSDYGSVTILKPDPNVGGLEVRPAAGDWIRAPSVDEAFIVNIGDLMAHWTNNRWVSTLHRVVAPDGDPVPRRQSIAYFMNPNYDAEICVIPTCRENGATTTPVTAGQYLIDKFRSAL